MAMAKAPKHAATITLKDVLDKYGSMQTVLCIVKVAEGRTDYTMETIYLINAYECAMDMARGNSENVRITHEVAKFFKEQGCDITYEWTIVDEPLHF